MIVKKVRTRKDFGTPALPYVEKTGDDEQESKSRGDPFHRVRQESSHVGFRKTPLVTIVILLG
jgi:hypothetical protein